MDTLDASRLAGCRQQFLKAATRYPHLQFVIARPLDPVGQWPFLPGRVNPENTFGISLGDAKRLVHALAPQGFQFTEANPLAAIWLVIDSQLWEGFFYSSGPRVPAEQLKDANEKMNRALARFRQLADQAEQFEQLLAPTANNECKRDVYPPPMHEFPESGRRWLECLHASLPVKALDTPPFRAHFLDGDLFTASARVIEGLASAWSTGADLQPRPSVYDLGQKNHDEAAVNKADLDDAVGRIIAEITQERADAEETAKRQAKLREQEALLEQASAEMCYFGKVDPKAFSEQNGSGQWALKFVRFVEVISSQGLGEKLQALIGDATSAFDQRGIHAAAALLAAAFGNEVARLKQNLQHLHEGGAVDGLGEVRDCLEYLCSRLVAIEPAPEPVTAQVQTAPTKEESSETPALTQSPATNDAVEPGWEFETGLFKFRGRPYDLPKLPLRILQEFVRTSYSALDCNHLAGLWETPASDETIRSHVVTVRKALREVAKDIGAERAIQADPLPNKGGGWRFLLPKK